MFIRCRRLKQAENKVFEQKNVRRFSMVYRGSQAMPPPILEQEDGEQLDGLDNDNGPIRIAVEVVLSMEPEQPSEKSLEQYEKLKQRQQEQMQALLLQQTQVTSASSMEDEPSLWAREPIPLLVMRTRWGVKTLVLNECDD